MNCSIHEISSSFLARGPVAEGWRFGIRDHVSHAVGANEEVLSFWRERSGGCLTTRLTPMSKGTKNVRALPVAEFRDVADHDVTEKA